MIRSLRSQLLIRIALSTLVVLSVAAVAAFLLVRKSLLEEFDSSLDTKAHAMATLVEQDHDKLKIEFTDHQMREFLRDDRPEYYEVWNKDGATIERSPHLGVNDLQLSLPSSDAPVFCFTDLPDGRRGRIVAIRFVPIVDDEVLLAARKSIAAQPGSNGGNSDKLPQLQPMTLALARGTEEIDDSVTRLAWIVIVASGGLLVLLMGALTWTVSKALQPLKSLASQIAGIDEHSLATRFNATSAPSEIVPVVEHANCLMRRLEQAFQRERTFAADVAHELRTPLAGLRSVLQVSLTRPRDLAEYRRAMHECEVICAGLQRLVETLLSLARLENEDARKEWGHIDIKVLVDNIWRSFEKTAQRRELQVTRNGPEGVFLHGDTDKMRVVLANLFDNAVSYANRAGKISISWKLCDAGLSLKVANTGCRLTSDQIPRVFERFWRGDSARANTGVHAGLGLALCRKIVTALDGTITAKCRDNIFEVRLAFNRGSIEVVHDSNVHALL